MNIVSVTQTTPRGETANLAARRFKTGKRAEVVSFCLEIRRYGSTVVAVALGLTFDRANYRARPGFSGEIYGNSVLNDKTNNRRLARREKRHPETKYACMYLHD